MALAKIKSKPYYTIEQYLGWERQADERSEFIDGEIYAMAGESGAHADISMNLANVSIFNISDKLVARLDAETAPHRCGYYDLSFF